MAVRNLSFGDYKVIPPSQQDVKLKTDSQEKYQSNNLGNGGGGKALASAIVPTLGQFCDGRNLAGLGFLATYGALGTSFGFIVKKACEIAENSPGQKKLMIMTAGVIVAGVITHLANIVDAYKGGLFKSANK